MLPCRRKLLFFVLFILSAYGFSLNLNDGPVTSREVIEKMLHAIAQVRGLKYETRINERIDGKMESGENQIKLQVKPFKSYVKVSSAELLFVKGSNNDKALIKVNSIPYFNISLEPNSSLLRRGQHHTIFELGFNYFADIIRAAVVSSGNEFNSNFLLKGSIKWEGRDCYVIIIEAPDFRFVPYVVKPGENLIDIARRLKVSEYMILERNASVKDYYNVKAGQEILIPTAYAKQTIIYVDKGNFLPVMQTMIDDKGIFEKYEYRNIILNPDFKEDEFTKGFRDYNFW